MNRLPGWMFAAALCANGSTAQAQFYSDFRILPNPAEAGRPVNLVVHAEWCDYGAAPQASVQMVGDLVTASAPDSDACFGVGGIARADLTIPLGSFGQGTYLMRFIGTTSQARLAEIPFTVLAAQAAPVSTPVGGGFAALALGSLLALLAAYGLRRRVE